MFRSSRLSLAFLGLPVVLAFASCGDGLVENPTSPVGNVAGVTATPTPAPLTVASPTPTPNAAGSCTLPTRPDCGNSGCCSEGGSPMFNAQINDAQADLERTRPDIFNNDGSLRLDEIEYTDLLAKKLMQLNPGMCARGGGQNGESFSKDEVAIKVDNNVSQNVDVIIGSSHVPYIGGRYTCRPASF